MNQQRWVGHGKLSECLGATEELKQIDIFMRELGFTKRTENFLQNRISKENLQYLEAYAEGVNTFMRLRQESIENTRYFHWLTGYFLSNFFI